MAVAVLVAAFFGTGIFLLFLGLAVRAQEVATMQRRLRAMTQDWGDAVAPAPQAPPARRELPFLSPLAARLADVVRRRTERGRLRATQQRLVTAGRPLGLGVGDYLALKAVAGVTVTGLAAYALLTSGFVLGALPVGLSATIGAVVLGLAGYYLPDVWLNRVIGRRRAAIRHQLPEVCDLLSVCADAGAPFDVALERVVNAPYMTGPLVDELEDAIHQARFTSSRFAALAAMAERVGVDELSAFITAIGNSFKQGAPIAAVLRVEAADIRRQARERAETRAATATLRMLFPLVLLILPTVFLIILTPALLNAVGNLGGSP